MAEVVIKIGSRSYALACRDGEEEHLQEMGRMLDDRASDAEQAMGPMSENRLLLFAGLLLADALTEKLQQQSDDADAASIAIDHLAARLEALVHALEPERSNA